MSEHFLEGVKRKKREGDRMGELRRKKFFRSRDIEEGTGLGYEELKKKDRERQLTERCRMIQETEHNKWDQMITKKGVQK